MATAATPPRENGRHVKVARCSRRRLDRCMCADNIGNSAPTCWLLCQSAPTACRARIASVGASLCKFDSTQRAKCRPSTGPQLHGADDQTIDQTLRVARHLSVKPWLPFQSLYRWEDYAYRTQNWLRTSKLLVAPKTHVR